MKSIKRQKLDKLMFDAVVAGRFFVVEELLSKGLTAANIQDEHQLTPMHQAARYGHLKILVLLQLTGGSVLALNKNNNTPLHSAAYGNNKLSIKLLMRMGARSDIANKDGDTPLHSAAWKGNVAAIEELAAQGADFNARNKDGDTPLHLAAWNNHVLAIDRIASLHTDILDAKNNDGETALHLAACKGHILAIKKLIDNGSDGEILNNSGLKFHQVAKFDTVNFINRLSMESFSKVGDYLRSNDLLSLSLISRSSYVLFNSNLKNTKDRASNNFSFLHQI